MLTLFKYNEDNRMSVFIVNFENHANLTLLLLTLKLWLTTGQTFQSHRRQNAEHVFFFLLLFYTPLRNEKKRLYEGCEVVENSFTQLTFSCPGSLEQIVKSVQWWFSNRDNGIINVFLVSLLLMLNRFHTLSCPGFSIVYFE